ncbi:MAG: hypothetical protein IJ433_03015 [Ruminococcus sp.]|nr:hypothetical protein [Ruminococcus sp.]
MKRITAVVLGIALILLSCVFVSIEKEQKPQEFYLYDGYIVKNENELNPLMADYATELFNRIYDEQLSNSGDIYFALIPDKHRVVGGLDDYDEFLSYMESNMSFAKTIEIADLLTLSDYYRTDPHWRVESVVDVVSRLCEGMDTALQADFEQLSMNEPFFGVYTNQSKLITDADKMVYLTSDSIESANVMGAHKMYDTEKYYGDDPYDLFLSGNQSVVKITNENANSDKRLVVFRDSFASCVAPLFSTAYKEVVLVDVRYIMSESLSDYVNFEDADVLFLYSTLLLNNSMSMK